jgi:hypothetical protein
VAQLSEGTHQLESVRKFATDLQDAVLLQL